MEGPSDRAASWNGVIGTASLAATSFVLGVYLGRKMTRLAARVKAVVQAGPTKLVLVARDDLRMGKGKLAAQCSHATLAAYQKLQVADPGLVQAWMDTGQTKVVVRATDLDQLHQLAKVAGEVGVQTCVVQDAGRTQVAAGTVTVMAVGPAPVNKVDAVTSHLRLM